jgi:hypothetical protein
LEGDLYLQCFFIEKRILRSFTTDEKDMKNVINLFTFEGWWITDLVLLGRNLPTRYRAIGLRVVIMHGSSRRSNVPAF